MTQEEKFADDRKRNLVAYAIEDFYDSVSDLRYVWLGNIALAAFVGIALIFGADNTVHVVFALLTAVLVYGVQHYIDLASWRNLVSVMAFYLLIVAVEYFTAGLPEPFIPMLTVEEGWVGFVPFANSLSPLLYFGVRLVLVYVIVNICVRRQALGRQNIGTLRQLDRDLAGKVE